MYFYMCSTERTLHPVIDRTISCHTQECLTHWSEQLLCINPCACLVWIAQLRGCSVNWNPTAFSLMPGQKVSDLTEKEMCSSRVQGGHRAEVVPWPPHWHGLAGKCLIWTVLWRFLCFLKSHSQWIWILSYPPLLANQEWGQPLPVLHTGDTSSQWWCLTRGDPWVVWFEEKA